MAEWSFLTNHSLVLSLIARNHRITGLELSKAIGITERAVRKVIADLDATGYIKKKREGRYIRYRINPDLSLRHQSHQEIAIGDFLEALGWKRRRSRKPQGATRGSSQDNPAG
jgi:DNA-binding transcriptional ArsR family regulator